MNFLEERVLQKEKCKMDCECRTCMKDCECGLCYLDSLELCILGGIHQCPGYIPKSKVERLILKLKRAIHKMEDRWRYEKE